MAPSWWSWSAVAGHSRLRGSGGSPSTTRWNASLRQVTALFEPGGRRNASSAHLCSETACREPPNGLREESNSRHEASYRHRSLEINRKQPGITYAAFLRARGRRLDPAWDIRDRNAEAKG